MKVAALLILLAAPLPAEDVPPIWGRPGDPCAEGDACVDVSTAAASPAFPNPSLSPPGPGDAFSPTPPSTTPLTGGALSPSKIEVRTERYPTGEVLAERRYYDGKLDGPSSDYYRNGKPMNAWTYSLGILHGESRSYYRNGDLKTIWSYKNGKLSGETRHFYPKNAVKAVETYKDGVLLRRKAYGADGKRLPSDDMKPPEGPKP